MSANRYYGFEHGWNAVCLSSLSQWKDAWVCLQTFWALHWDAVWTKAPSNSSDKASAWYHQTSPTLKRQSQTESQMISLSDKVNNAVSARYRRMLLIYCDKDRKKEVCKRKCVDGLMCGEKYGITACLREACHKSPLVLLDGPETVSGIFWCHFLPRQHWHAYEGGREREGLLLATVFFNVGSFIEDSSCQL